MSIMPIIYNAENSIKVDEWDSKFIALTKNGHNYDYSISDFILDAKKIWAERCLLHVEHVETEYLVQHFLPMISQLNPRNVMTLINMSDPKAFRWVGRKDIPGYWDMALYNIGSIFALTKVSYLEGYKRD